MPLKHKASIYKYLSTPSTTCKKLTKPIIFSAKNPFKAPRQYIMSSQFWQNKTLAEMSQDEWGSLCDRCGRCCLHKLEDEDTGEVFYTNVACKLLDIDECRCTDYRRRQALVNDCMVLSASDISTFHWLPSTCAYRLIHESKPLFTWHPLISGESNSVHSANISVKGRSLTESAVATNTLQEHIIHWIK